MNILLILLIAAGAWLLFVVYLLIKYLRIIVNIFLDVPVVSAPHDALAISHEDVEFRSLDGITLRGIFLKRDERGPTVIFCHEFGSDMNSCIRYAGFLLDSGINIFSFDFCGHGKSSNVPDYVPRQWVTSNEVDDILGAIAYLAGRRDVNPNKIGLFGLSKGASSAICAASHSRYVKAIVADGAFSVARTLEEYIRRWASIFARIKIVYNNMPNWVYRTLRRTAIRLSEMKLHTHYPSIEFALSKIAPRPIFFIHGSLDSYIDVSQADFLSSKVRGVKELWVVPNARHNEGYVAAQNEYAQRIADFFKKYLNEEIIIKGKKERAGKPEKSVRALNERPHPYAGEPARR